MNNLRSKNIYAIIGDPVEHSRSPEIYEPLFTSIGKSIEFLKLRIPKDELNTINSVIKENNLSGFAVTMPHKKEIINYLDLLDSTAIDACSVNIVSVNKNANSTILTGYNTDGIGLISAIESKGVDLEKKRIVMLGNGGAALGAKAALIKKQCQIDTLVRNANYTLKQAIELNGKLIKNCDVLINATPLGMKGYPEHETFDFMNLMKKDAVLVDMVYAARGGSNYTKFIETAQSKNLCTVSGEDMLYFQGLAAFKIWTNSFDY